MAAPPERDFHPPTLGASEQIAAQIRRYLEQQHLAPGDRIGTEQGLATEFGVSRPTLREALRLLAASQLIRVGRGRSGGIFVAHTPAAAMGRSVSDSVTSMLAADSLDLAQLLDARMAIEVPVAGRAAVHAGPTDLSALEAAIEAGTGRRPGTPEFDAADADFHRALAAASGNPMLIALTGWIVDVLQPRLVDAISGHVSASAILDQHTQVLRAVRREQAGAAERAMAAHVQYLMDRLAVGPRRGADT